ncbi:DnaJ domain-containing protein [Arcobacter sp. FWKO B]|uniref:DnaJ domain-containing protein n=1 Tax=Arcobacter sp. FWKO B TaxID=2593672 RepID=UPI0018A6594B|nr:DnaJ domain-containing protein [Arcobacter sp. FWKO B]QOG11358.1 molecular chaperone DjlA [Arcobacter sp. FWKO B]
MEKVVFLLFVGVVLYIIARNYKTEDFQNIKIGTKQRLIGDLKDHEAGLLVALMAKVAKADGQVCELEAELLGHTFNDIASHFENSEEIKAQLKEIYNLEKQSFDNTVLLAQKYLKLTKRDYDKRLKVLEYLLNIAFIDGEFSETEFMIVEDISNAMQINKIDLEALIKRFERFHQEQKMHKINTLENAYSILEANESDSNDDIKKKYRNLVRKHHPDIVTGKGGDEASIAEATKKLQEINEAYEIIKKQRGI